MWLLLLPWLLPLPWLVLLLLQKLTQILAMCAHLPFVYLQLVRLHHVRLHHVWQQVGQTLLQQAVAGWSVCACWD